MKAMASKAHGNTGSSHLDANGAWPKNCLWLESKTFLPRATSPSAEGAGERGSKEGRKCEMGTAIKVSRGDLSMRDLT